MLEYSIPNFPDFTLAVDDDGQVILEAEGELSLQEATKLARSALRFWEDTVLPELKEEGFRELYATPESRSRWRLFLRVGFMPSSQDEWELSMKL